MALYSEKKTALFNVDRIAKAYYCAQGKVCYVHCTFYFHDVNTEFALVFFYIDRSLLAANQFAGLGAAAVIPALFYAIIQTGLSEELLFRGFLLKRLMKIFDFQVANLLQSIVFGCVHGAMLWSVLPLHVILLVVLTTALAGYVMGWVNERIAGSSIVTSWSIHSIVNFIAACLYMFKF